MHNIAPYITAKQFKFIEQTTATTTITSQYYAFPSYQLEFNIDSGRGIPIIIAY